MKQKVLCKATAMHGGSGNAIRQLPKSIRNFFRVMKITGVILLVAILQVSAASYAQKVTIHQQNSDLKTVLNAIRKQTGYYFIFDKDALQKAKPVTIDANNEELTTVLTNICSKQQLGYEIKDKVITITSREDAPNAAANRR
jgi:hypothetical protein